LIAINCEPMSFPNPSKADQNKLEEQIHLLQGDLEKIQSQIHAFESLLRTELSDLIVESQELFSLYKQIKKAKKAKRLEQKKRGKNYKEPKGLLRSPGKKKSLLKPEQRKEKKRLYREAMLHVHPDKFQMNEKDTEVATEITSRLIEIYQTESLERLQAYHAHIFNGNTNIILTDTASKVKIVAKDNHLQQDIKRLEKEIEIAKNDHLYKVLTEYESPMTYVDELKEYYELRIVQLKKRTRKGL